MVAPLGSKWISVLSLVGGILAQVAQARDLVGAVVADACTVVGLIISSLLGGAILRPSSSHTRDTDADGWVKE